jgi:hypothetical protein
MTLTLGLRQTAIAALIIAVALAVWLWGNQRHVQAGEDTLAGQILCYIDSTYGPPIPRFNIDECPPPAPPPPPPAPSVEDTLSLCSDGVDNDGDSLIDLADPNCSSFSPKLVVVKTVINDNGGTASISSFLLYIGKGTSATTTVMSGATTTVASGTWRIGEISNAAYAGTFGGDCNANGEVTLLTGDTKTCTITNDDIAPPAPADDGGGSPSTDSTPSTGSTGSPQASSGSSSGGGGGGGGGSIGSALGTATTSTPSVSSASSTAFQASCGTYLTAFISPNGKNDAEQVRRLQTVLRDFESAQVQVNGVYDATTLAAVNAFQSKYARDILAPWGASRPTGYVYLTTRKKVNEIYCRNARRFDLTAQELATIQQTKAEAQSAPESPRATVSPIAVPLVGIKALPQTMSPSAGASGKKEFIAQTAAVQEAAVGMVGKRSLWESILNLFRQR